MLTSKKHLLVLLTAVALLLLVPQVAYAQEDDGAAVGGAIFWLFCCAVSVVINIILLVWVVRDANNRGTSAGAWLIVVLIFGILGFLAYLVARPQGKLVDCPNCGRKKPIRDQVCPHCGTRVA